MNQGLLFTEPVLRICLARHDIEAEVYSASRRRAPPNPAWIGVITRTGRALANSCAKLASVSGPPPPCTSKKGLASPSTTLTYTGPTSWRAASNDRPYFSHSPHSVPASPSHQPSSNALALEQASGLLA
jgi:hypothetical protein